MSQGIYIAGGEARNGKSVIILGVMEMIAGQRGKIGFFRPVVQDEKKPDRLTDLIIRRYGLDLPYDKMFGCTYQTARDLLVRDRDEDLLKLILDKYRALEQECDFIVCAGSDYTSAAAALEFDLNARIANNLGCTVLPVVKGHGKNGGQIVGAAQGLLESLEDRQCAIFGLVVNRVAEQIVAAVKAELQAGAAEGYPRLCLSRAHFSGKADGRRDCRRPGGRAGERHRGELYQGGREFQGCGHGTAPLPGAYRRGESGHRPR